jgi:hypothetical protein
MKSALMPDAREGTAMTLDLSKQLEIFGLDEVRYRIQQSVISPNEKKKQLGLVETTHKMLSELPEAADLRFMHSGLCQTTLPHSKPEFDHTIWEKTSGRFTLSITPGAVRRGRDKTRFFGVPYGTRARLIMFHLQSEGIKSRHVDLGPTLSAFLRSMGLAVTGGKNGTIERTKDQVVRLAACSMMLHWSESDEVGASTVIQRNDIVDKLKMWEPRDDPDGNRWEAQITLTQKFYDDLCKHAVPMDKRAIAALKGNSMGLDLYSLFAYRLPRLVKPLHLPWRLLHSQIGSELTEMKALSRSVRDVMPSVMACYPHAQVTLTPTGLTLRKSEPAVLTRQVQGATLLLV